MNELLNLVDELKKRIEKYGKDLSNSEAMTRYVIVDPVLRVLGWDTENPEVVRPEETTEEGNRPDYTLYLNGNAFVTLEVKKLGSKLDERSVLKLGFDYSWSNKIPYFIITDGNVWRIYDVKEPGGKLIFEVNILKDSREDVVRKLLSLWKPLMKGEIKTIEIIEPKESGKELDPDKVKEFYDSLTKKEKAFIEIVFEAWRGKRELSKNEIIDELKKRGISVDKRGFTGIKSGITRLSGKMHLPPPMPTESELGNEYWSDERKRYKLKDEWGQALEKIIKKKEGTLAGANSIKEEIVRMMAEYKPEYIE